MERDLETFLRNIAWLRAHHGLSKRRMCRILNIGAATLDKIERGELPPMLDIEIAFRIDAEFGIPPAVLFSRRLGK